MFQRLQTEWINFLEDCLQKYSVFWLSSEVGFLVSDTENIAFESFCIHIFYSPTRQSSTSPFCNSPTVVSTGMEFGHNTIIVINLALSILIYGTFILSLFVSNMHIFVKIVLFFILLFRFVWKELFLTFLIIKGNLLWCHHEDIHNFQNIYTLAWNLGRHMVS